MTTLFAATWLGIIFALVAMFFEVPGVQNSPALVVALGVLLIALSLAGAAWLIRREREAKARLEATRAEAEERRGAIHGDDDEYY